VPVDPDQVIDSVFAFVSSRRRKTAVESPRGWGFSTRALPTCGPSLTTRFLEFYIPEVRPAAIWRWC
jgi:hypothetical protein